MAMQELQVKASTSSSNEDQDADLSSCAHSTSSNTTTEGTSTATIAVSPDTCYFPTTTMKKSLTTETETSNTGTSSCVSPPSSDYDGILLEGDEEDDDDGDDDGELQQLQHHHRDMAKTPQTLQDRTTPSPPHSAMGDTAHVNYHYHLLRQIREDQASVDDDDDGGDGSSDNNTTTTTTADNETKGGGLKPKHQATKDNTTTTPYFQPYYTSSKLVYWFSSQCIPIFFTQMEQPEQDFCAATWIGFFALLNVTCANYVLTPMRDAVALQVGVHNIPKLTLASSVLAFFSSVPIGWLFEAPDPSRRKVWKAMGLTRGETQGTSLALFYRFFALSVMSYAIGFTLVDYYMGGSSDDNNDNAADNKNAAAAMSRFFMTNNSAAWIPYLLNQLGFGMYVAFFLVVHLMKLHSISLVWGVTTEAMEYEDVARKQHYAKHPKLALMKKTTKTRLQRLAMVGFGGTVGGLWGSILASSMANILHLPGLLILSAFLLEISAQLSIELGRIMQKHWEEQQNIFRSCQDLTNLDTSMQRSTSLGSMKRIASGNSLYRGQSRSVASLESLDKPNSTTTQTMTTPSTPLHTTTTTTAATSTIPPPDDANTFTQRLLRGITTILRSRLLMAIFTYNALFASTSVLLSFQRAELVANRNKKNSDDNSSISNDTAFLANINMASSMAVFAMQASGIGAWIAQRFGSRGSLALMPAIRLLAVLGLAWWHRTSNGQPPNLILFLILDECTRVVNLAIAKPVRESLWRGLSNEARYEAKPIVDTLANRWGAGSASFCVSIVNKLLLWWLGSHAVVAAETTTPQIFGLSPVLFLCLIVAAWWSMVSLDLGHIRRRIDLELKKHQ